MADIINLRRARKRKQREQAAAQAAENRVRFGLTPAQRRLNDAQAELERRRLELLRLTPDATDDSDDG